MSNRNQEHRARHHEYLGANRSLSRILEFLLLSLSLPAFVAAQAGKAAIDGSFITGDSCKTWRDAKWQREFALMKEDGMHYVIIQAVAEGYPGRVTKTWYPSSLPNTEMARDKNGEPYPDVVNALLMNAKAAGIKVFMGIDESDYWWHVYGSDPPWLYSQMHFDNKICDELWARYKKKYPKTFCGWYWAYEVDNVNWATKADQEVLTKAMNIQLDHLDAANERLPVMWCPFMNTKLGTPSAYEKMWKNVLAGLHTRPGDIFCPQDGVGVGHLALDELTSWYSALRQAVDTKPGLLMWSDVETFNSRDWTPASIGRVVSQLKLERPYVSDYVTWAYLFYDSPYSVNPGYQETYLDYLKTGSVEKTPPTIPTNITAILRPNGNVDIKWDPSTDSIGVCGYHIYRNGRRIFKDLSPMRGQSAGGDAIATSFRAEGLRADTKYVFRVQSYDFAGNLSGLSMPATVVTGDPKYEVISLGCHYTVSAMPSKNYPDPNRTKLTDNRFTSSPSYPKHDWVGFGNQRSLSVTIKLRKVTSVQQFIADYLFDPDRAVDLPEAVRVSVSTNDNSFKEMGKMVNTTPNDSSVSSHRYYFTLSSPTKARYVRFTTVAGGGWIFVDGYEVLRPRK